MDEKKNSDLENENARLRGLLMQAGTDAAANDIANKLQKLLIAELHHRVKNLLSMVLSITTQTLRSASSLEAAHESVQNRIMILSRSFDLLVQGELDAAALDAVIENASEPYNESQRISIAVPRISIAAQPALSMALVINELCTNAVKHGSLSNEVGMVKITGVIEEGTLSLTWIEKDGPPVRQPKKRSFGMTMISSVVPEARVTLDFEPSGLVFRMAIPVSALAKLETPTETLRRISSA